MYGDKNKIMYEILSKIKENMILLKFLYYIDETKNDIRLLPDLTSEQIKMVVDDFIYKHERVEANTKTDKRCYLSMEYGQKQYHASNNPYFNGNTFNIYILCDREVDYILANGSRVYAIEQCLVDIFDDSEVKSIGRSKAGMSSPIHINGSNYIGVHFPIEFYDKQLGGAYGKH